MNNGTMFGGLKKYKDEGFWKQNQYFTIYTTKTLQQRVGMLKMNFLKEQKFHGFFYTKIL